MFAAKNELLTTPSGGYRISRSLRFRSSASANLNRTPASAGNRKTWTWSGWVKRGGLGVVDYEVFNAGYTSGTTNYQRIMFYGDQIYSDLILSNTVSFRIVTTAVYRDPSSWYHLVVVYDSGNATAANRAIIYVNGVQAALSTTTYPSLNQDGLINSVIVHNISGQLSSTALDGYLAEVNFIDGSALTPTSFGAFDTNGVWQPKAYTGTYGTNGFYLPFSLNTTSTYAGSFNGSSQLLSVADNAVFTMGSGDFTIEAWVNFAASGRQVVVYQGDAAGSNASISFYLEKETSNFLRFYVGSGTTSYLATGSTVVPNNQWVHIAGVRNGNNIICYLNGIQQATTSVTGVTINDSTNPVQISGYGNGTAVGLLVNGSISNVRIVKGTAIYTSNFTPPTSALTAISGTSLLCLQSSSVTQDNSGNSLTITNVASVATSTATPFVANVTADASGNNNGWISANINASSSGTTYDSMIDSPTNYADGGNGRGNYCTWNPTNSSATLSNANLSVSAGSSTGVLGTMAVPTSGSWYWETTVSTLPGTNQALVGILGINQPDGLRNLTIDGVRVLAQSNGILIGNGTTYQSGLTAWSNGDVIAVAYNSGSNSLQFYRNNSTYGSAITVPANTYAPYCGSTGNTSVFVGNFGQRPFSYTPPSGFSALNTQNLPTPTIAAGNKYFDATTYGGTGSTNPITNSGSFQPDLVWIRNRGAASGGMLLDAVRTSSVFLQTTNTNGDGSNSGDFVSFNPAGFSVGGNGNLANASSNTYVGWQWKGGNGTSNIAVNAYGSTPSIASTVSANTSAGFSVVTFTAPASGSASIAHGLGVTPAMFVIKSRSPSTSAWALWHTSLASTTASYLTLNTPDAVGTLAGVWGSGPTSSVFGIGTGIYVASNTYVAYCFAPVAGYSAFGSYTGNGSASGDGPFIYTGFRPRWVLIKRYETTTGTGNWVVYDTSRNTYNETNLELWPNSTNGGLTYEATSSNVPIDILSNGFKIKSNGADVNASSSATYIYAAFCELPFKIARAR